MAKSIQISLEPNWDEVEKVRNRSSTFLKARGLSKDTVYSVTMVLSELIENGIKYGNFTLPKTGVTASIDVDQDAVTVEVTNPVGESAYDHLEKLDRTIQWIRGHQDPFEAYTERLREVARKPLDSQESGLGLVRIAYEGKAILDFFLDEDDLVSVSAVSHLDGEYSR